MRNRPAPLLSWVLSAFLATGMAASNASAQTTGGSTTGGSTTGGSTTGGSTTGGSTGSVLNSGGGGGNSNSGGSAGAAAGSGAVNSGNSFASGNASTGVANRTGAFNTGTSLTNPSAPASSATGIPSTANPLRTAYGNPYVVGAPITSNTSFGQPLYGKASTSNTTNSQNAANNTAHGFSALGTTRIPSYTAVLSDDFPRVSHPVAEIRGKVEAAIQNSSFLKNKEAINISVQDRVVVLTGQVGTEKERRIAEGMIRLTPGVMDVRNNLQVLGAAPGRTDNP